MNLLSLLSRITILAGTTALLGFLLNQHAGIFFSIAASSFMLLIAAHDYSSAARRSQRLRVLAPVQTNVTSAHGLQLAA